MATAAAIRKDIARVEGLRHDQGFQARMAERWQGGIEGYLAGQRARLAALERPVVATVATTPATPLPGGNGNGQGTPAVKVNGQIVGTPSVFIFPVPRDVISPPVTPPAAPPGGTPGKAYNGVITPAAPVPGVTIPAMPGVVQAFSGIGAFITQYAPWLMIIALIYAVGTVLNIGVKAGVGK